MPEILLTTVCDKTPMTFQELTWYADMIAVTGSPRAGLTGEEPLRHPSFIDVVSYLQARGISTTVFTTGLCEDALIEDVGRRLDGSNLEFIVNASLSRDTPTAEQTRQEAFVTRFADRCDLALDVLQAEVDVAGLVGMVERTDLRGRRIHVRVVEPDGECHAGLTDPAACKAMAANVVRLAEAVFPYRLALAFDCGFPLCAFTDEQLGALRRYNAETRFVCPRRIVLAPGMRAWSCLSLAKQTVTRMEGHPSLEEVEAGFATRLESLRQEHRTGVFNECTECVFRSNGVCDGGCLAHVVA